MSLEEASHQESDLLTELRFPNVESCQMEIVDMQKQIEALTKEIESLLPLGEIQSFLSKMNEYLTLHPEAATTLLQSIQNTDVFKNVDSVGVKTALNSKENSSFQIIRHVLNRSKRPRPFVTDSAIKHNADIPGYDALYENGKIKTSGSNVSINEVLTSLVEEGSFPSGLQSVFHESVHRKQHKDLQETHSIRTQGIPNTVLNEALARRAADYPISEFEEVPEKVIAELSYATRVGSGTNYYISETKESSRDDIKNEWTNAFLLIDLYQGLGLTIGEISQLFEVFVRQKKSDIESKSLGLQSYIQKKTQKRIAAIGLSNEDEKKDYMKLLQKRKHLQAHLSQLSARKALIVGFNTLKK